MEHVRETSERLVDRSRIIADAIDEGRTAVVGVTYHLADGEAQAVSRFGLQAPVLD